MRVCVKNTQSATPNVEFSYMARRLNFFPVPEDITYSLLNILFDIFWDSINLVYVSKLVEEGLVYDYLFTSQRESHSIPDMDFFAVPYLFCPI